MRLLIAALALTFCASCDSPLDAIRAAARARVDAAPVMLPDLPPECRQTAAGGVAPGDPLDRAALRLAADRRALNARLAGCAAWYDALRAGLAGPV